ncbi:hypothetical protein M427DRAFT_138976 [Gonapodya prolifera JEL478]|uniref:Nicastrin n=1 Tax=Gonapodya prolifera (strain JEL478) TaxID=1344416 RepID=A0A139A1T9_GONPJ|nr:hypothetical protein M427DRAFT_138976 [Gonapodya prolifera JEL478]|eukprot:KXS10704.1 hypothetical protein M427DRAFT_138976 [Gonapodya prolifera JEL478]
MLPLHSHRSHGHWRPSSPSFPSFLLLLLLVFLVRAPHPAFADLLDTTVYQALDLAPCTRLLNASGVIGCQNFGASGVLYAIDTSDDLASFVAGTQKDSYVAVVPMAMLTTSTIQTLRNTGKLSAIVVTPGTLLPSSSSPFTPLATSGFEWNPNGTSLSFQSFDIPIYAAWPTSNASQVNIDAINEAVAYNRDKGYNGYPMYSADFDGLMYAQRDSDTCLRRGTCDPVGSVSIWSSHSRLITPSDTKPILLVAAALDAASFFHDLATGLDTHVAGLVAVMAVAEAMARSPTSPTTFAKHILYTTFAAEAWSRAGSERFARDLRTFTCVKDKDAACPLVNQACGRPCVANTEFRNVSWGNIESILELSQILGPLYPTSPPSNLTFYTHSSSATSSLASRLAAASADALVRIVPAQGSNGLPPSSSGAFARNGVPAVVVVEHSGAFTNSYYNSELDGYPYTTFNASLYTPTVCSVASSTAKTLWRLAQNLDANATLPTGWDVNCTVVRDWLDCFVRNFSCPLVTGIPFSVSGATHVSHYSGVWNYYNPNPIAYVVSNWLTSTLAHTKGPAGGCNASSPCSANGNPSGTSCIYNQCVAATVKYHYAYGTGLEYDFDKGYFTVVDPAQGTWTESRWYSTRFRIFMATSRTIQGVEVAVGLALTLASGAGMWWTRRWVNEKMKQA